MKKVKQYKGFVIAYSTDDKAYHIFTKEEWSYGKGYRYEEHETGSIEEAIDFIENY